jgi:zinc transport system permease protein
VSLSRGFNADLFSYLFGSILTVSETDIFLILLLGAGVLSVVLLLYKELFYITFDESSAKASGLPVENLDTLLVVLTSVVVVISMRIVGILLVSSLIVIPATTALLLFNGFKKTMLGAIAIAVTAVTIGLILAYYFSLAAGGSIVMVLVAMFSAVLLLKRR